MATPFEILVTGLYSRLIFDSIFSAQFISSPIHPDSSEPSAFCCWYCISRSLYSFSLSAAFTCLFMRISSRISCLLMSRLRAVAISLAFSSSFRQDSLLSGVFPVPCVLSPELRNRGPKPPCCLCSCIQAVRPFCSVCLPGTWLR